MVKLNLQSIKLTSGEPLPENLPPDTVLKVTAVTGTVPNLAELLKRGVKSLPQSDIVSIPVSSMALTTHTFQAPSAIEQVEQRSGPEGFKDRLKALDDLIVAGSGISQLSLDTARNHVAAISTELRTFPEYDGLLIDRDIHNIIQFVRASMSFSGESFTAKARAKDKKAASSNRISQLNVDKFLEGLGPTRDLDVGDLASLSFDDVKPRGKTK